MDAVVVAFGALRGDDAERDIAIRRNPFLHIAVRTKPFIGQLKNIPVSRSRGGILVLKPAVVRPASVGVIKLDSLHAAGL